MVQNVVLSYFSSLSNCSVSIEPLHTPQFGSNVTIGVRPFNDVLAMNDLVLKQNYSIIGQLLLIESAPNRKVD